MPLTKQNYMSTFIHTLFGKLCIYATALRISIEPFPYFRNGGNQGAVVMPLRLTVVAVVARLLLPIIQNPSIDHSSMNIPDEWCSQSYEV
jgi:hypothetical protein